MKFHHQSIDGGCAICQGQKYSIAGNANPLVSSPDTVMRLMHCNQSLPVTTTLVPSARTEAFEWCATLIECHNNDACTLPVTLRNVERSTYQAVSHDDVNHVPTPNFGASSDLNNRRNFRQPSVHR